MIVFRVSNGLLAAALFGAASLGVLATPSSAGAQSSGPVSLTPIKKPAPATAKRAAPRTQTAPEGPAKAGDGVGRLGLGGVQVDSLQTLDPDAVGLLTSTDGGFGISMWRGARRNFVERMLPALPVTAPSAVMRDLTRRLLLSAADVPDGPSAGSSLVAIRVRVLTAMGEHAAAFKLLQAVPGTVRDRELARVEAEARFLANDNARACAITGAELEDADSAFWQQAHVFCQLLAGENEKASLGLSLMREIGSVDAAYLALADGLVSSQQPVVESLPEPSPLHLAMARVARAQLPDDVISSNRPGVLRSIATSPNASKGLRLEAGERADAAGALAVDTLRQIYTSVEFSETDLANPLTRAETESGPLIRALLYHAALLQTVPVARAEVIAKALELARREGRYISTVHVFQPILAKVPPSAELLWFAPEAFRALLLMGDQEKADAWFRLIRSSAVLNTEAQVVLHRLVPVARLMGYRETSEWSPEVLERWWRVTEQRPGAVHKGALLYAMLEGMGEKVPPAHWERLVSTDANGKSMSMPGPALWRRLVAAADGEEITPAAATAEASATPAAKSTEAVPSGPAAILPDKSIVSTKVASASLLSVPKAAPTVESVSSAATSITAAGKAPLGIEAVPLATPAGAAQAGPRRDRPPVGEAVLVSLLALGEKGPGAAHPMVLYRVVKALRAARMIDEARAVAVEAVLAAGL